MADFDQIREGLAGLIPDAPKEVTQPTVTEQPLAEVQVEQPVVEQPKTEETTVNPVQYFAEQLGYTGDIEGDDLDTLIRIAKSTVKEPEVDPRYQAFMEHIDAGGTQETFLEMQPSTVYKDAVIDEADIELQEQVARIALVNLNGFSVEQADNFINTLKDSNQLFNYSQTNLTTLAKLEQQENATREQQIKERIAADKQETINYYNSIDTIFKERKLIGLTNLEYIDEVRNLSIPDSKGNLGIDAILETVGSKPELIATANYMIHCLVNGKQFAFNPNVIRNGGKINVQDVFGKKSGETAKAGNIEELASMFNK